MIEAIDDRLEDWISKIQEGVAVSFSSPGRERIKTGVGVYLMELLPDVASRGASGAPIQMTLRYLVSIRSEDPRRAHQLLGKLVVAALQEGAYEVELAPPRASLWTAFGVEPRPCFFLRLPLKVDRPTEDDPLVRRPLSVRHRPLATLSGQVLAPGDVPLRDAVIEWRGVTSPPTDPSGRFRLAGFARHARDETIRVRLRKHEFTFPVPQELKEGQPMTIRLGEMEV